MTQNGQQQTATGWKKREVVTGTFVYLGDDEGQKRKAGGLLAAIVRDSMYPDKHNYELVQKDGESIILSGSATLARQIFETDIGKFVKCEFKGWGKSKNGKYKEIDVNIYEGEPTADMKAWPRFAELNGTRRPAPAATSGAPSEEFEEFPGALEDEDDDLPF